MSATETIISTFGKTTRNPATDTAISATKDIIKHLLQSQLLVGGAFTLSGFSGRAIICLKRVTLGIPINYRSVQNARKSIFLGFVRIFTKGGFRNSTTGAMSCKYRTSSGNSLGVVIKPTSRVVSSYYCFFRISLT